MMKRASSVGLISLGLLVGLSAPACSAGGGSSGQGDGDGSGDGDSGGDGDGGISVGDGDGDLVVPGDGDGDGDGVDEENPATCEIAEANRTYVGCEFWPTITANPLYTDFDFAVVLANGGTEDATVTVSGGGMAADIVDTVPAGGLKAITLPWVAALKGPEFSRANTSDGRAKASVRADGGAFKVTSTLPVTAWQFNPLQFKKSGLSNCAGSSFGTADCFSVSNDASLLVPATAMTENYRVFGRSGKETGIWGDAPGGMAITATRDNTNVKILLGPNCGSETWNPPTLGNCIAAGTGITAAAAGDVVEYTLNAGDVLSLLGDVGAGAELKHADISGSVVEASLPVQVIAFNPITTMPDPTVGNADHIEELVLPAQVLGKSYLVAPPSNPNGVLQGGHIVRIYGNVDGTTLTYDGTPPAGAPASINAGEVVELAVSTNSYLVSGSESFAVGSFMLGGALQGSGACPDYPCSGDPAFSMMVTPEQFRTRYTFLAPTDYDANFADVLIPDGATVTIDGAAVVGSEAVAPGWSLARVPLAAAGGGSHYLESDIPVGLQVMGFGHATSYYYPGGLNLKLISPPPPPVVVK